MDVVLQKKCMTDVVYVNTRQINKCSRCKQLTVTDARAVMARRRSKGRILLSVRHSRHCRVVSTTKEPFECVHHEIVIHECVRLACSPNSFTHGLARAIHVAPLASFHFPLCDQPRRHLGSFALLGRHP